MCGDFYPVTEPGRLIGMATLAVGVGILGVLTSYLAQFFLDQPTSRIFAFGWMTTLAICPDDGPPRPAMTTEHGTDPLLESIGADDALVPGWLRRLAAIGWRVLATLALGVVLVFAAVQLAIVTAAIIVGMIISATLAPWVHRLRRDRGWGRTKAAGAVTGAGVLILAAAIVLLVLAFVPYVDDVIASVRAGFAALSTWLQSISVPPEAVGTIDDFGSSVQAWITGAIESLIAPIASTVTILLLAGFLTFFLLQDGDKAWTAATSRMDPWRAEALTQRGRIALERVGGYLRGTAIMSATDAVSDALFLTLLGVPLAGPLAVLVFLGGFIPYIGGFITTTIMLLVTISTVGVEAAVILLVLIVIVNIFQGNLLAPMVYGKMVDIHPALVLIALPAGAALFGIIGLFAALPMVAFAMAFTPAIIKALDDGPEVEDHHALVPAWLDRLGQWSWRALVVFAIAGVAISVAVRIPTVIVPVVLAIVLGATLDPVAAALRRRGVGRGLAALTVIGVTALVVIVVTVLTLRSMVSALPEMVDTANAGAEAANVGSVAIDVVAKVGVDAAAAILGLVSDLASLGLVLVLSMLLTFYFLRDGASFWARVVARRGRLAASTVGVGRRSRRRDPQRVHGRDRDHRAVRGDHAVVHHGRPGPAAGRADRRAGVLRWVHPVHRERDHHAARVPRRGRRGHPDGHPDHVRVHDRVQHRPGQLRGATRLRPDHQPASGDRAAGHPGGRRGGGHPRDVPGRPVPGCRRRDLADDPAHVRPGRRHRVGDGARAGGIAGARAGQRADALTRGQSRREIRSIDAFHAR